MRYQVYQYVELPWWKFYLFLTVSNAYSYNSIGNIVTMSGNSYTYCSNRPHAVEYVGGTQYGYDENGNMTYRSSDNRTIEWDAENRPVTISVNGTEIASFVYDGDGNRIKKFEGGQEIVYINRYYEKNLTGGNATSSYYLGSRLVAQREGDVLRYVHQDHLTGTSMMSDSEGSLISSIKYLPFGGTLSGSVPTYRKFTGQRLDEGTGLYYYGARYYDPAIGRFISADSFVQWSAGFDVISNQLTVDRIPQGLGLVLAPQGNYPDTALQAPVNPQSLNRYSYCGNNPLCYIDSTGSWINLAIGALVGAASYTACLVVKNYMNRGNEDWNIWEHGFEGFSGRDFAFSVAIGTITGGAFGAANIFYNTGVFTASEAGLLYAGGVASAASANYQYQLNNGDSQEDAMIDTTATYLGGAGALVKPVLPVVVDVASEIYQETREETNAYYSSLSIYYMEYYYDHYDYLNLLYADYVY